MNSIDKTYFWINEFEGNRVEHAIAYWLNDFWQSNLTSKEWRDEQIANLACEDEHKAFFVNVIKKISRLVRDFLKVRDSLTHLSYQDALSQKIFSAIKQNRFRIIHSEKKDVHAEIRLLTTKLSANSDKNNYIGISKLCCGHCALALHAFNVKSRGWHGQSARWPIAETLRDHPEYFKRLVGNNVYSLFQRLPVKEQQQAIQYIESKESNPLKGNARQGRQMAADSSESDIGFDVECSDEEQKDELMRFSLLENQSFQKIKINYNIYYEFLKELDYSCADILSLYSNDKAQFKIFSDKTVLNKIEEIAKTENVSLYEAHDKLSEVYEEEEDFFWDVIYDQHEFIREFGLDEMKEEYQASLEKYARYDSDGEEIDHFTLVGQRLRKDNSWDYSTSSDSERSEEGNYSSSDQDSCLSTSEDTEEELISCDNELPCEHYRRFRY